MGTAGSLEHRALNVALVGCGTVGRGVYQSIRRYPQAFTLHDVVVRDVGRYADVEKITSQTRSVIMAPYIDVVIICTTSSPQIPALMDAALAAGKFVITANKADIATYGQRLIGQSASEGGRLRYSAAVGGAMPALETLATIRSAVREIRFGIVNGTCGAVLEAWSAGGQRQDAIRAAQAAGFAEADPSRDLSGRDSADKLALLTVAAFARWISPIDISTRGIDEIDGDPSGFKLVARATRAPTGIITASVAPRATAHRSSFLGPRTRAREPPRRLSSSRGRSSSSEDRGRAVGRRRHRSWATCMRSLVT